MIPSPLHRMLLLVASESQQGDPYPPCAGADSESTSLTSSAESAPALSLIYLESDTHCGADPCLICRRIQRHLGIYRKHHNCNCYHCEKARLILADMDRARAGAALEKGLETKPREEGEDS